MEFKDLSEEQKRRARACSTPEEMLALAREEGYELSDQELEGVAGGSWSCPDDCTTNYSCPSYYVCPSNHGLT